MVIVCLGLDATLEGEEGDTGNEYGSGDKPNLKLPGRQLDILKLAVESGKPVVLVELSGSAMDLSYASENVSAILQGWYPGAEGGYAIARALFGDISPEGKLPVTFYKTSEELPDFKDYSMKGRTYRYMKNDALYPFGYGLSYSKFTFDNLMIDTGMVSKAGVKLSVDIKNEGSRNAGEAVEVYVKVNPADDGATNVPNYQLKGLKKVFLRAGETKNVRIELPAEAFSLFDEDGKQMLYKGNYEIFVGGQAPDRRSAELTGNEMLKAELTNAKTVEI